MKMDVRHVVSTYLPYLAGTGNVVGAYARFLAKRKHDVTVLTPQYRSVDAREEVIDGVHVRRLRAHIKWGNAAFVPGLSKELDGADIVHFHAPFFGGAEAVNLMGSPRGPPMVVTYHNDVLLGGVVGRVARLESRVVLHPLLRRASVILVPSREFGARSSIAGYQWEVLEHGVDTSLFQPGVRRPQAVGDFTQDGGFLLFVGVLDGAHHYKGLDDVIAALRDLPGCRLAIVGDGGRREYYEQLARPLGNRVKFLGTKQAQDLAALYASADVTLFPSREFESYGLVVLESLACGTPVVATDIVGGASRLLQQGVTGYVVPPYDPAAMAKAIARALEPSFRAAARPICVQIAKMHSWEGVVDRLVAIYERALQT